jgi:hypothetical protein
VKTDPEFNRRFNEHHRQSQATTMVVLFVFVALVMLLFAVFVK